MKVRVVVKVRAGMRKAEEDEERNTGCLVIGEIA
jgi:hypothetical protein